MKRIRGTGRWMTDPALEKVLGGRIMGKESMPCITEDLLRHYADEQSFKRGMEYYYHEAISEPLREGFLLRGFCEGSRHEPYRVRVLLEEEGIREASCTCPRGGFCINGRNLSFV